MFYLLVVKYGTFESFRHVLELLHKFDKHLDNLLWRWEPNKVSIPILVTMGSVLNRQIRVLQKQNHAPLLLGMDR